MDGSLAPDCHKPFVLGIEADGVQWNVSWLLFHFLWTHELQAGNTMQFLCTKRGGAKHNEN